MQDTWQAVILGLIIGAGVGYLLSRFTKVGSAQSEQELQQLRSQVETQKQQLENHFSQSADLLKDLAEDYKKLYLYLANSSTTLLPELAKPIFSNSNLLTVDAEKENTEEDTLQRNVVSSATNEEEYVQNVEEKNTEITENSNTKEQVQVLNDNIEKNTKTVTEMSEDKTLENAQPKDYSEGSSGLLKSEK